jgi:hypothetical protein
MTAHLRTAAIVSLKRVAMVIVAALADRDLAHAWRASGVSRKHRGFGFDDGLSGMGVSAPLIPNPPALLARVAALFPESDDQAV